MKRRTFLTGSAALGAAGAIHLHADDRRTGAPLKVAYFSDVHAREDAATVEQITRAAAQINARKADLVIGGGDYIHGGFRSDEASMRPRWQAARQFLDSLQGRVELIHGNHDLVGAGNGVDDPYRVAREELGIPVGARRFTVGDFTFFCLDSVQIDPTVTGPGYRALITDSQLQWLDGEIARLGKADPVLLITHIPFRTLFHQSGETPLAAIGPSQLVANASAVLDRFAEHNLIAVLQGHLHLDEHLRLNDLSFITAGAVCGGWWNGPNRGTYRGSGTLDLGGQSPRWIYASYRTEA